MLCKNNLRGTTKRTSEGGLITSTTIKSSREKPPKNSSTPPPASPTPCEKMSYTEERESAASSPTNSVGNRLPAGLILKGGRVRLPDKLMEYLNNSVAPDALYWMPEGECFAIDTEKAPEHFLDKYFGGTKVASFLRSISRWGFKRVFYHELGRHIYAFHHPLFQKNAPHLEREMKMIVSACSESKKAKRSKKRDEEKTQVQAAAAKEENDGNTVQTVSSFLAQPPVVVSYPTTSGPIQSVPTPAVFAALPAVAAPQLGAPLSPTMKEVILHRLLQPASTQQILDVNVPRLTAQGPQEQLARLLVLQGNLFHGDTGASSNTDVLRLAVAMQQQQQLLQQQQREAALALQVLNAVQKSTTP